MASRTGGRCRPAPAIVVAALALFVGSTLPLPARHAPEFGPFGPDKVLHLVGHAGFAAALLDGYGGDRPGVRAGVAVVVVSTTYGVGTELLQEVVPGRQFERGDVLAGLAGSVLGVACWHRLAAPSRRRGATVGTRPDAARHD